MFPVLDPERETVSMAAAVERSGRGAYLALGIVLLVALMAALSTDVIRAGDGVKSDDVVRLILEAVRQIRGTSTNQVPGCETCLVTSGAGVPTSAFVVGA